MDSLTIDTSQIIHGTIAQPVFSGELSVLSSVDLDDEQGWVRDFGDSILDSSFQLNLPLKEIAAANIQLHSMYGSF